METKKKKLLVGQNGKPSTYTIHRLTESYGSYIRLRQRTTRITTYEKRSENFLFSTIKWSRRQKKEKTSTRACENLINRRRLTKIAEIEWCKQITDGGDAHTQPYERPASAYHYYYFFLGF